jgi:hypothetical protein
MGIVGAAVSVVSGIAGISQQNKQADAQRAQIQAANEQQALQAQLQLLSLKQQTYANGLNDYITDATRTLQYQQQQNQLEAQRSLNDLAVSNAVYEASMSKSNAAIQQTAADTQASRQASDANQGARQQQLQTQAAANNQQDQLVQQLTQMLGGGAQQNTNIANLLDAAMAHGGNNEALANLLGQNSNDAIVAAANLARGQQVQQMTTGLGQQVANASIGLNNADAQTARGINAINATQSFYNSDKQSQDALFSQQITNAGFNATQAANNASNNIGILSDQANRYSRDYLNQVNQNATLQGAQIQSNSLNAQANAVQSPGFFDYLGVGLNGYNTYNALTPKPVQPLQYATK